MLGLPLLASSTDAAVSAGWFLEHAWLIALIPAVAYAVIMLFGKRLPYGGSEVGIASLAAASVLSIGAVAQWIGLGHDAQPVVKTITWWESGPFHFGLGQYIDGLSLMLLIVVSIISMLVQIFSLDYVRGDRRYTQFFGAMTLFSAGMLTMVLAENMIQIILGWEIMGLCSFMLIGHWWEETYNSESALKAFWTVRVGDTGLLIGTAVLLGIFGTLSIGEINDTAASGVGYNHSTLAVAAVFLFIACIGKSGQFPLHTWLPDAMAGPTPVSSLLHSSTMVVAGVFLVARIYPVFHQGLDINVAGQHVNLIALIGGITILMAAALAFVQNDIKKVLAYSTVSQLGYMMMGLGVGAWTAAVFHIFTHAFFKCCLFLCAGSISHTGSHHSFDMKENMGGLRKKMPITFAAWMVSTAALCSVPLFSGFFSKDEIIDAAHHNNYTIFWIAGLAGAFLTTGYMTRATYLTFFGKPRGAAAHFVEGHHDDHAHALHNDEADEAHPAHHPEHLVGSRSFGFARSDSGWMLTAPLIILGVLAVISGYLNAPAFGIEKFHHWVTPPVIDSLVPDAPEFTWLKALPAIALVIIAFALTVALCKAIFEEGRSPFKGLTERSRLLGAGHKFLVNKYYLDHLYTGIIVRGIGHPIAQAFYWFNQNILDGIVNYVGNSGRKTGRWVYRYIDQGLVDGVVNGSGTAASETGEALRPTQSGKVSQYGALLFGAAAIGALVLVIVNS